MTIEGGVANIQTITYSITIPEYGIEKIGTSATSARGDHVHRQVLQIGVWISASIPYLESTSTLCYIWTPNNKLYWDSDLEMLYYA